MLPDAWRDSYHRLGWVRFPQDPNIRAWAAYARLAARGAMQAEENAQWWDCENTWFIGVDALPTDETGRLPGGPALAGAALDFIAQQHGEVFPLHRAQLSAVLEGYPRPRRGESEAAFRYRRDRDAAHVDGVKIFGTSRRRRVEEPHAWVLGLPLNQTTPEAAPLVVWEGSHLVMGCAFATAFQGIDPIDWHLVDVTDTYTAARREVFERCRRTIVHAQPGEAYVMHRLCLHGVAPWGQGAAARSDEEVPRPGPDEEEGRLIAYFRPEMAEWQRQWLTDLGQ